MSGNARNFSPGALKNLINGISRPAGPAVARVKTSNPGIAYWPPNHPRSFLCFPVLSARRLSLRSFAVNSQLEGFARHTHTYTYTYTRCPSICCYFIVRRSEDHGGSRTLCYALKIVDKPATFKGSSELNDEPFNMYSIAFRCKRFLTITRPSDFRSVQIYEITRVSFT